MANRATQGNVRHIDIIPIKIEYHSLLDVKIRLEK